jgi:hypothetical protein
MVPFILTAGSINMVIAGKPVAVHPNDKHFAAIYDLLKAGASEEAIATEIQAELLRLTAAVAISPNLSVKDGSIYYEGEVLHNALTVRLLQMLEEGFNLTPMVNFLENLMKNPSYRVVEKLYTFLEYGKNAITEDGHFLAYKAVRADFMDIHSGTFNNSVGQAPSVLRRNVDDNPNNVCSYGLHVCSFDYLSFFASANGHVMVCKINPADVVSIPVDYRETKMRVCKYEVISEYEGYYTAERENMLAASSVIQHEGAVAVPPFSVVTRNSVNSGDLFSKPVFYDSLVDAAVALEEALDSSTDVYDAAIFNTLTGTEIIRTKNADYVESFAYEDDEEDEEDEDEGNTW